jgi:hypothetical protein
MSTICLGMMFGLPHLQMAGWGVFIASRTIIAVRQKQQLSVDGRTRQSGAHRTSTVHCLVPCHVSRPLGSVAVDRWIRPFPDSPVHTGQSGAIAQSTYCGPLYADCLGVPPDSPVDTGQVLFTVWCTTNALLTALCMNFFAVSFGLLFLLSLGLLRIFYVFF